MYNIIFFADIAYSYCIARSQGIQRLASDLRGKGYKVLCVNFTSSMSFSMYEKILDKAIGPETFMVGFSTTFFPYHDKTLETGNNRRSMSADPKRCSDEYYPESHPWYFQSLPYMFTQVDTQPWIDAVKKRNPNTKFVIGGTKSAEYIRTPNIDHVFLGYAETMIMEYVDSLSGKGRKILFNKVVDYDPKAESPIWDFRNAPTTYNEEDGLSPNDTLGFEFSRGCIFNCAFCSFPLIGRKNIKDSLKCKELIYNELLENYTKWGITKYFIVDDTFNDSLEKLELINDIIKSLPFQPYFWAYTRVDLFHANPRMAELMYEIGVREINFGLETFNPETAKIVRKGNPEIKKKSLKLAKEVWGNDVYIISNYIVGLPKESVSSIKDATRWFIDEGYKYTDELSMFALTLINRFGDQQIFLSDIERNHEKFGYTLVNDNKGGWTKNDGTDLISRDQSLELIAEMQTQIYDARGGSYYKNLFYATTYRDFDDRLSIENLIKMKNEEYASIEDTIDTTVLYKQYAEKTYWPKLFKVLGI
jgi:radical SAM superfamily enzyme YgiQ (UPF0313 family)